MALNLPTGDESFNRVPIIKYDARAGRLFRVDRTQNGGTWETSNVEITQGFMAIMDLENIETGWLHFPTGGAPDIRVSKIEDAKPDRPSPKHRGGFRVFMKLGKGCGGDLREMAANAAVSIKGMNALHNDYLAGLAANPGKLPVVQLERTDSITSSGKDANGASQSSTNYQPVWRIAAWADRPAELQPGYVAATVAAAAGPAPSPVPAAPPPPAPLPPPPAAAPIPSPAPAPVDVLADF